MGTDQGEQWLQSMDPIRFWFPGLDDDGWFSAPYDYDDLVRAMGVEIVADRSDDDYQGDSYLLVRRPGWWGFLTFGWGSCSGCDALQGCSSYDELDELRLSLASGIHWEPSAAELLVWMAGRDWSLEWSWYRGTCRVFLREASGVLAANGGDPLHALAVVEMTKRKDDE